MNVQEKLAKNAIKQGKSSHITLNKEVCTNCGNQICLRACPAELYTVEPDSGEVLVDHSGCLECGTCLIVCPEGSVSWQYPDAGFGIRYRLG